MCVLFLLSFLELIDLICTNLSRYSTRLTGHIISIEEERRTGRKKEGRKKEGKERRKEGRKKMDGKGGGQVFFSFFLS